MNITLSDSAIAKINEILKDENNPKMSMRIFVHGGGCSGFSYGFAIDDVNEDDWEIQCGTTVVKVDAVSAQYLEGASVNYVEDLMGSSFKINNPGATSTCSCGSSFSY